MGILSRLIVGAAAEAIVDSIEQNNNRNSPYYNSNPGSFVVCTNCAFTIEGGNPNCPRCGAQAYQQPPQQPMPVMTSQQQPAPPMPNTQPAPSQSLGFCGSCGAARVIPGPCEYCGK